MPGSRGRVRERIVTRRAVFDDLPWRVYHEQAGGLPEPVVTLLAGFDQRGDAWAWAAALREVLAVAGCGIQTVGRRGGRWSARRRRHGY